MSSREYWRRREAAQLEKNITEEAAYDAALQKIYSTMLDSIDSNIRSFYSRYATSEGITLAEAKRRADKLDIEEYARKAARYVETKDFSERANEEMKLYNMTMKVNRLELLKANIGAEMTAGYNDIEKMMGDALTKRTLEEIERQAGILGITINNNAELANSIVNASFHNATWSDRVWASQEELHAKVAQNLTKGLIQGVNSRTLASNLIPLIQDDVKNKRAAAERLMRTELARVQIDAQKRSYVEGGYEEYEIICDFQACHICKPYDGKHYPVAKMEIGENAPPFHPNCRCSTAVYIGDEQNNSIEKLDENGKIKTERGIKKQSSDSLRKGIQTLENRISEHEDKVTNPYIDYPDWDDFPTEYQDGLIRHWNKEIRNFKKSIQNRRDELRRRGENPDEKND